MSTCLVYSPDLAAYDLGADHPLRPERFTLAVELMEAYGLVPGSTSAGAPRDDPTPLLVISPRIAPDEDLLLVHSPEYLAAVRAAGLPGASAVGSARFGIGTMDTPAFPHMHEAAALVAGATTVALAEVVSGRTLRAFSISGGLHHAHRARAGGFCVYNDAAVAIAAALRADPDLRVLYVDLDAHHGDGVQEVFYEEPRVLTVSIHETGHALYPGTGFQSERGTGAGLGSAANVPLPPLSTDACYRLAFEEAVAPLARRFRPDLIVAQCGADAHHDDPLTSLGLTLPGHRWLVRGIVGLADDLCGGRVVALGGGGYGWEHVVPRAWTAVAAELSASEVPQPLPEAWRERVRAVARVEPPATLASDRFQVDERVEARLLELTKASVAELMAGA